LDEFEKAGKKKSVKRLLEKLHARERELNEALSQKPRKKEAKELKEELSIVTVQIKKGEKILKELNEG
jgi:hypothetical protein